jgi:hypothetical protein
MLSESRLSWLDKTDARAAGGLQYGSLTCKLVDEVGTPPPTVLCCVARAGLVADPSDCIGGNVGPSHAQCPSLDTCIDEAAACLGLCQCQASLDGHIGAVCDADKHALGHWVALNLLEAANSCGALNGGCRVQVKGNSSSSSSSKGRRYLTVKCGPVIQHIYQVMLSQAQAHATRQHSSC